MADMTTTPTLKRLVANDGEIVVYEEGELMFRFGPTFFVTKDNPGVNQAERRFERLYDFADRCGGLVEQSVDDADTMLARLRDRMF